MWLLLLFLFTLYLILWTTFKIFQCCYVSIRDGDTSSLVALLCIILLISPFLQFNFEINSNFGQNFQSRQQHQQHQRFRFHFHDGDQQYQWQGGRPRNLVSEKMMRKEAYRTLGLPENALPKQIKNSFRSLSLKWHPDKNNGNEKIAKEKYLKIMAAYELLSSKEKR